MARHSYTPGGGCRRLLWFIDAVRGRLRRRRGRYDRTTLACFYRAWRLRPSTANLIAYLRFRRDLGRPVPRRLCRQLIDRVESFSPGSARRLVNWAAESLGMEALRGLPEPTLRMLAGQSPVVAALVEGKETEKIRVRRQTEVSDPARLLARHHSAQEPWRSQFADHLRGHSGRICVVGNAPTIEGRSLGAAIDGFEVVVRFNRFVDDTASQGDGEDAGRRLDVWVCAPDLSPPYPRASRTAEWVVLTGPDARYHLGRWENVVPLLSAGQKVLTVPLGVWRGLVRELGAPPSAGILSLAWLIELAGGTDKLTAVGFQRSSDAPAGRYHFALPRHRPSSRHDWEAERRLLRRWGEEGLRFLD